MSKKIIDVSEHQKKINWATVKSHIDGAIIRLGYGDDDADQDDDYVAYNIAECERLGIPCEVYLYSYANSNAQIQSEIAHIKRLISGRSIKRVWLDLEERRYQSFWRKAAEAFLKAFPDGGIYTWEWVFTDILDGIECPRWICAYGPNDGQPHSDYRPHLSCHGWQYTSKASVPGITGTVDMSEWYGDFAETQAEAAADAPAETATRPTVRREDIVAQMLAWEGWSEKNGKFKAIIDIYNRYLPTAVKSGTLNYAVKYADEWCATAASAAYIAAGAPELFPIECGCPRTITLAQRMGIWKEADEYVPKPADAVLYDWQDSGSGDNQGTPDHIGIVISVDEKAGTFVVMEGNKDETVGRRTMKINGRYIRGFVAPEFSTATPSTAPSTTPSTAPSTTTTEEKKTMAKVYEVSGTGTPSKKVVKTGLLKFGQKVTARRQPKVTGEPCSFSPVSPLTRIDVCDTIADETGKKWDYCCVGGKYGYILNSSIRDYLRVGGLPVATVAQQVIKGDFGNAETRSNALKALGYNAQKVQDEVNRILGVTAKLPSACNRIRLAALAFFDTGDEASQFGDCTALIEYGSDDKTVEHAVLIDTAKDNSHANVIKKLKALGVKKLDAIIISHAHGDHYGGLTNIMKAFPASDIYVPDCTELDKYQKSYGDALRRQYKKAEGHYIKKGTAFSIGSMKFECIYQCKAADLDEHDDHHFVNNMSVVLRVNLNGWLYHTAGDLQNPGNNLLIKAVKSLQADIFKAQWHGDGNACNDAICKAVKPKIAFSNYHHKESKGGRQTMRKRLEAVGATVARNWENGDIWIDCLPGSMKLSCSKGNLSKTWTKAVPAASATDAPAYRVCLTTKAEPVKGSGILAVEPEDYTAAEIGALKAAGYKVLGYLSVGSVSDERSYYKSLEKHTLRKLDDWEHERYLDVASTDIQQWAVRRGKEIIEQGCDGLWIDNLDVYEEYPSDNAYKGITAILQALYASGYIMVNGGIAYMTKAMQAGLKVANGITQEEVFSRITDYDAPGQFGTQTAEQSAEYQKYIALALSKSIDAFLLEYTRDGALREKIMAYCKASGAGCYISEDVDL